MKKIIQLFLMLLVAAQVQAYEYPSKETVYYALSCMADIGEQNDENLYTCICRYDTIRAAMPYSEYEEGITFERNRRMPGEKGAFFRDNKRGENFYKQLVKVREEANSNCPIVKRIRVARPDPK